MTAQRRPPRREDLAPLLRFKRPVFTTSAARLQDALTIADLRTLARRRTPLVAFDYAEGGADEEISLHRARTAFRDIEFRPRVLRDVSVVDTSTEVLGRRSALPFGIAPTGFTRMLHTAGERAGATAAAAAGIPFALSTLGTVSIEEVAAVAPDGRRWFQLYVSRDRDRTVELVQRAAAAGFDVLMVTVDTPVSGARLRDRRNGMTIPPVLTLRTALDAVVRPRWWLDLITTEPFTFATLDTRSGVRPELMDSMFNPAITFEDLGWIRRQWPGKLVLKGVQTAADAVRAVELGVDAILLSSHGGRQLDRVAAPLHVLPEVVREIGGAAEIHLDSGITHGADIAVALALGADFTLVGRAYLYGLMAGGRRGVDRAIAILAEQLQRTMRLLGVTRIDDLSPEHVSALRRSSND